MRISATSVSMSPQEMRVGVRTALSFGCTDTVLTAISSFSLNIKMAPVSSKLLLYWKKRRRKMHWYWLLQLLQQPWREKDGSDGALVHPASFKKRKRHGAYHHLVRESALDGDVSFCIRIVISNWQENSMRRFCTSLNLHVSENWNFVHRIARQSENYIYACICMRTHTLPWQCWKSKIQVGTKVETLTSGCRGHMETAQLICLY